MYKNKTSAFGIPVVGKGDVIEEKEELKKYRIIENQLLAASKGVKACVFEEGHYHVHTDDQKTFVAHLVGTGASPTLMGMVFSGLIMTDDEIRWAGLSKGKTYHLYVEFSPKLYEDPKAFSIKSSEKQESLANGRLLYLASIDLTGDSPVINTFPDGKVYSSDIAQHSNDTTNPHGVDLIQDRLTVRSQILVDIGEDEDNAAAIMIRDIRKVDCPSIEADVELRFKDMKYSSTLEKLVKGNARVVKFVSGGIVGTEVVVHEIEMVEGAMASQEVEKIFRTDVGDIGIEYFGNNKVKVYNSGSSGITMRLIAWGR